MNEPNITGNAVNTPISNKPSEQIIINDSELLKEHRHYAQTFDVYKTAKFYINLTADDSVNYVLLSNSEFDHYTKGESFKSYASSEQVLFIQDTYNLNSGKYSIVVTTTDKPANIHLFVKAIEL